MSRPVEVFQLVSPHVMGCWLFVCFFHSFLLTCHVCVILFSTVMFVLLSPLIHWDVLVNFMICFSKLSQVVSFESLSVVYSQPVRWLWVFILLLGVVSCLNACWCEILWLKMMLLRIKRFSAFCFDVYYFLSSEFVEKVFSDFQKIKPKTKRQNLSSVLIWSLNVWSPDERLLSPSRCTPSSGCRTLTRCLSWTPERSGLKPRGLCCTLTGRGGFHGYCL